MRPENAIALLSGGLDSTVALAMAADEYDIGKALFFDYGQCAAGREKRAAGEIASFYGVELEKMELPWLGELSSSAIIAEVPKTRSSGGSGGKAVWVENRNGIFLNIAAAVAVSSGCEVVLVGFNMEEAETFPDNSVDYINAVNRALELGELSRVRVESHTADMRKNDIVREGIEREIPWESLWSCYRGGERMCGECESCLKLKNAVAGTAVESIINFAGE